MTKIPLTLIFMTSTKQHFGFKDVYATTLNHLNKQVPLSDFATKIAHIKVSPGEEALGDSMDSDLTKRGFKVLRTTAAWTRGLSHQNEYMKDLIKVSEEDSVYENEHILWLEDDSTMEFHGIDIYGGLNRMIGMLKKDRELVSVRLLRRSDLSTSPVLQASVDYFYSPHFNFQPLVLRSRDFYLASKMIDDNMGSFASVQSEMIWRLVLKPFSRSESRHAVFYPDYAETVHLGVDTYPILKNNLGL